MKTKMMIMTMSICNDSIVSNSNVNKNISIGLIIKKWSSGGNPILMIRNMSELEVISKTIHIVQLWAKRSYLISYYPKYKR